ncbi:hypothetical protein MMC21_001892 [Puttea exsequens]|nr:hypothetical protein [Puttea exsequens]
MGKSKKQKASSPLRKSASPAETNSRGETSVEHEASRPQETSDEKPKPNPDESFESYYLRLITASFPDDIDKVRSAPDFKDSSMPVLIEALKQGVHSFTDEEKARIMGAGKS